MAIHILRYGQPLCGFSTALPGTWQDHTWVRESEYEQADCPNCVHIVYNESYKPKLDGFTCPCVRVNRELGIYDMTEQEKAGRKPLGLGVVSECQTAEKDCSECDGTGWKVRERKSRFDRI